MKIKIKGLIFVEFLGTLSDMYLLDHFHTYTKNIYIFQATGQGQIICLSTEYFGVSEVATCSSRHRLHLFHLLFSLLEIQVFYLRVVFSTAWLENGLGVVLASILLPKELLTGLWRRDSLSSFPPGLIHRLVSGMREQTFLTWPQARL